MIVMKTVDWQPIANLPEDRKDGRQMLLWDGNEANIARWAKDAVLDSHWDTGYVSELDGAAITVFNPTMWADINAPE